MDREKDPGVGRSCRPWPWASYHFPSSASVSVGASSLSPSPKFPFPIDSFLLPLEGAQAPLSPQEYSAPDLLGYLGALGGEVLPGFWLFWPALSLGLRLAYL